MDLVPMRAIVRKDLQVFFSDRRSVIMSFVVPIAIASFFGSIFNGPSQGGEPARIAVAIVDHDASAISKDIVSGVQADKSFTATTPAEDEARDAVRRGSVVVAVVIPKGFGQASGNAFFGNGDKPALGLLYDPSRGIELAMVRGIMTQHVMEAVSKQMFGGQQGREMVERTLPQIQSSALPDDQKRALMQLLSSVQQLYNQQPAPGGRGAGTGAAGGGSRGAGNSAADSGARGTRGITVPYTVHEEEVTAGSDVPYNGYAHSFGGMAVQFLLFAMANLGVDMLLERQRGIWGRLRSAPVSKLTLLSAKIASGAIISLMILFVTFLFAIVVFKVRIQGSLAGMLGVAIACSLMASTFGVLVAALGGTPATARGVTSLAVLMMVMLGGAWVPTFVFPKWLQQITTVVPVRWAVDGFDAMTWRGIGLGGALVPIAVLLGFAALFGAVAASRFKWEEG